jgi:hypothetical protein
MGVNLFNARLVHTLFASVKRYCQLMCMENQSHVMSTDSYNFLSQHTSKKELVRKEVDDVLGGAAAWENVDSVESKNASNMNKAPYLY